MKKFKEELENVELQVNITKDLLTLLDDYFQSSRYKDNATLDYWSITRLFSQYTSLSYEINKKVCEIEKNVSELVKMAYKES